MAFTPDFNIHRLSRLEICELGSELCDAVIRECGTAVYNGGINDSSVTVNSDGRLVLMSAPSGSSEERERLYASPELFWHGKRGPAGTVYAIGLLLYYASEGRLPFVSAECDEEQAQQIRMGGAAVPVPVKAGRLLGSIIVGALSFEESGRYKNVGELKILLDGCMKNLFIKDESASEAIFNKDNEGLSDIEKMMVDIISNNNELEENVPGQAEPVEKAPDDAEEKAPEQPEPSAEMQEEPSAQEGEPESAQQTEDESFEWYNSTASESCPEEQFTGAENAATEELLSWPEEIDQEENESPILPEEVYHSPKADNSSGRAADDSAPIRRVSVTPDLAPVSVKRKADKKDDFPDITVSTDGKIIKASQKKESKELIRSRRRPLIFILALCGILIISAIVFNAMNTTEKAAAKTAAESEALLEEAERKLELEAAPVTPSPTPTPEPVKMVSTYELITGNVSWNAARQHCNDMGGHLVVINDATELQKVIALAEASGIDYIWIGLHRENGTLIWDDGDNTAEYYYDWAEGEPSEFDGDTPEDYVLLWNHNGWHYNDCIADPSALYNWYVNNLAYVCEIETPEADN